MTTSPAFVPARLAFYYVALFGVIGIHMPFWPVWLQEQGLNADEIGIIVAAGITAKILGNPLAAHVADRLGERRHLMVRLAFGATALFTLFALTSGFWSILAVTILFFLFWGPIIPLGESLAMLSVERTGMDYARVRLWGSLSFIAAAVVAGRSLVAEPVGVLYALILSALAMTFASTFTLPDERAPKATGRAPLGGVLTDRRFLLFLVAAALIQGSHGVYYAFGSIHWRTAGYSEDVIGWLWAEGVIAEIILFTMGTRLMRRYGPAKLLMLGGLAAMVRWSATGLSDALPVLVLVQALHAFTFGAAHLGAIHFITRAVTPSLSATAQSIYSALVMGLGMGLSVFAAGHLYAEFGAGAFHAMAATAVLGTFAAWRLANACKQS